MQRGMLCTGIASKLNDICRLTQSFAAPLTCLSSATRASTIKGRRMLSMHEEYRRSRTLERTEPGTKPSTQRALLSRRTTARRLCFATRSVGGGCSRGLRHAGQDDERPQAVALSSTAMLHTTTESFPTSTCVSTTPLRRPRGLDIRLRSSISTGIARRRKSKEPQQCITAGEAASASTAR